MQKVISINLNGNAYQLDESGYDALREYLERAVHQLDGNPDRAEMRSTNLVWPPLLRKLDRIDPGYKT